MLMMHALWFLVCCDGVCGAECGNAENKVVLWCSPERTHLAIKGKSF